MAISSTLFLFLHTRDLSTKLRQMEAESALSSNQLTGMSYTKLLNQCDTIKKRILNHASQCNYGTYLYCAHYRYMNTNHCPFLPDIDIFLIRIQTVINKSARGIFQGNGQHGQELKRLRFTPLIYQLSNCWQCCKILNLKKFITGNFFNSPSYCFFVKVHFSDEERPFSFL